MKKTGLFRSYRGLIAKDDTHKSHEHATCVSESKQVRTPAETGYEPNAVLKAMAQRRGGSLPPSRSDAALARCKLWQQRKAIRS